MTCYCSDVSLWGAFRSVFGLFLPTFQDSVAATYSAVNIYKKNLAFTCDFFPTASFDTKTRFLKSSIRNDYVLLWWHIFDFAFCVSVIRRSKFRKIAFLPSWNKTTNIRKHSSFFSVSWMRRRGSGSILWTQHTKCHGFFILSDYRQKATSKLTKTRLLAELIIINIAVISDLVHTV